MDAVQRSHVEMSRFYSNLPHKPLLPTMNLRLGNRVLRLESQSQTAECFGKLTRALAWETASSLMQQRSQSLTAKHVEEGRSGGALNLAAKFQSARCSGGYVTAVIEASVGGCNCGKGKLSGWAGLFKMKARAAFAEMRALLWVRQLC